MTQVETSKSVAYILTGDVGANVYKSVGYILTGEENTAQVAKAVAYILIGEPPIPDMTIIRAWGCSLDGHDFYLLRLGTDYTMVYDDATEQWSHWHSPDSDVFRAHLGLNWYGFNTTTIGRGFSWNIIGADDTTNNLWILDPTVGDDEDTVSGSTPFERQVLGAVPIRGREVISCNQAYVTMNLGSPQVTGGAITLSTSDDSGQTWLDHGTITVTSTDYSQEIVWHGLGLITAPGRLFKLTDEGAAVRISSLDIR